MRLNPDCFRDLLILIQDEVDNQPKMFNIPDGVNEKFKTIVAKYGEESVVYHMRQIEMNGFVTKCEIFPNGDMFRVGSLTPRGHEFVENTYNPDIWKNIKERALSIGSLSVQVLQQIAVNYFSNMI